MKPFILIALMFTLSPAFLVGTVRADDPVARAIMEKVDERDNGDRSIADMKMVLINKQGKQRVRTIRSYGMDRGEDHLSLMFFLAPADVASTGFLTHDYDVPDRDDEQWLYLPALHKTKRIATGDKSGSFMGSDFSYADLTSRRLEDYDYTFHEKQREVEVNGRKAFVLKFNEARNMEWMDEVYLAEYDEEENTIEKLKPFDGGDYFYRKELAEIEEGLSRK